MYREKRKDIIFKKGAGGFQIFCTVHTYIRINSITRLLLRRGKNKIKTSKKRWETVKEKGRKMNAGRGKIKGKTLVR
jgi:hypothetical protein